jgi:hypothetical protein
MLASSFHFGIRPRAAYHNSVRRPHADEYRRSDERRGHLRFSPRTISLQNRRNLRDYRRRHPTLRRQQHSRPPPHGSRRASRPECRRQLGRRQSRLQRKIQRQSSSHGRRPVYVPSFSGVFYEVLDFPLEQISRIEVIRGSGGSVWGTNAVNGVINILTKKPPLPQVLPSSQVAPPLSMAPHCFSKAAASLQYNGGPRHGPAVPRRPHWQDRL